MNETDGAFIARVDAEHQQCVATLVSQVAPELRPLLAAGLPSEPGSATDLWIDREVELEVRRALLGYCDWLAFKIWQRKERQTSFPIPSLNKHDVEAILRYGSRGDSLKIVVAAILKGCILPVVGRVTQGCITPAYDAIAQWAGIYLWKATFEQADRAANELSEQLGSPDWLLGIGVESDEVEGFVLSVRTSGRHPRLPKRVQGVAVRVLRRTLARAR